MQSAHYRGSIDGDIKAYLIEFYESGAVCPTFQGHEPFEQLWDMGVVTPEITSIRLMFNHGREDEHYIVVDKDCMVGLKLMAHSGREGEHNIEEMLSQTKADYWEVDSLHPRHSENKRSTRASQ